jgi:2-polyprenyl-3-methyl-5-hydroxy-6-metoxy-1,4-benzoquinol methylase
MPNSRISLGRPETVREYGKTIDFGRTAADYGRHRAGFPPALFERLEAMGVLRAGMRALDLGTGTGTLARGVAQRGCAVTGLDRP